MRAATRDEQDGQQGQQAAERERERGCERRVPWAGDVVLVEVELGLEVRAERVALGEFGGDLVRGLRRSPFASYSLARSASSAPDWTRRACCSLAMSARWVSRWLLTDTYSPSAIEIAPPTSPARPAARMGALLRCRARDTDDDCRDGHDAVVRAENARRAASSVCSRAPLPGAHDCRGAGPTKRGHSDYLSTRIRADSSKDRRALR